MSPREPPPCAELRSHRRSARLAAGGEQMHGLIERRSAESKSRVSGLSSGRAAEPPRGAVVLGGDFNGLAVVRSLGRRGIPVCVIDDERSIARASRYATHAIDVPSLRDDAGVVAAVLRIGRLLGLD